MNRIGVVGKSCSRNGIGKKGKEKEKERKKRYRKCEWADWESVDGSFARDCYRHLEIATLEFHCHHSPTLPLYIAAPPPWAPKSFQSPVVSPKNYVFHTSCFGNSTLLHRTRIFWWKNLKVLTASWYSTDTTRMNIKGDTGEKGKNVLERLLHWLRFLGKGHWKRVMAETRTRSSNFSMLSCWTLSRSGCSYFSSLITFATSNALTLHNSYPNFRGKTFYVDEASKWHLPLHAISREFYKLQMNSGNENNLLMIQF